MMTRETEKIEEPTADEQERSINAILDAAMPARRTLPGEIKRLFNTIGIKNTFTGVGDAIAAALMVSIGILLTLSIFIAQSYYDPERDLMLLPIMTASPVFYFTMLSFASWKERMTGTWQVLACCRYNLKYITAIRLIIVSAAGVLFLPIATIPLMQRLEYPNIIAACLCAVFLYSVLTLLALLISERLIYQFIVPLAWAVFWGALSACFSPMQVERFIANMPLAFNVAFASIMIVIYVLQLRIFILKTTRRTRICYQ